MDVWRVEDVDPEDLITSRQGYSLYEALSIPIELPLSKPAFAQEKNLSLIAPRTGPNRLRTGCEGVGPNHPFRSVA